MDGTASSLNKTPRTKRSGRNEETGGNRGRVLVVELIVEPVVVPVPLSVLEVQVADVEVAVRIAVSRKASSGTPSLDYSQD